MIIHFLNDVIVTFLNDVSCYLSHLWRFVFFWFGGIPLWVSPNNHSKGFGPIYFLVKTLRAINFQNWYQPKRLLLYLICVLLFRLRENRWHMVYIYNTRNCGWMETENCTRNFKAINYLGGHILGRILLRHIRGWKWPNNPIYRAY